MRRPQALHKDRLLLVGEQFRVGTSVFSQKLDRPLQHRALELEPVDVSLEGGLHRLEFLDGHVLLLAGHPGWRLLAQKLSLPIVEGGALDAYVVSYGLGGFPSGDEAHHSVLLARVRDASTCFVPYAKPGRKLVYPCSEKLLGRVAEHPTGSGQAPSMLEVVIYRHPLQAIAIALIGVGIGDIVAIGHILPIPVVERSSGGVSQLVDDGLRTEVELDEQLDGPKLVFSRVHADLRKLSVFGSDFRQHPLTWIKRCEHYGIVRSMSARGCSPDNSAMEGFFGRMKVEFFYGRDWKGWTTERFKDELDSYIRWYNEERIKLSLGGMSPVQYRKSLGLAA